MKELGAIIVWLILMFLAALELISGDYFTSVVLGIGFIIQTMVVIKALLKWAFYFFA